MHPLLRSYYSWSGRLRRRAYWWSALALTIAFAALFALLEQTAGHTSTLILYPPFLWAAGALMAKRLHDRDTSSWWLLIAIVPIVGPLWLFITLGFRRGTSGENRYGADPRTVDADYLTVRIAS